MKANESKRRAQAETLKAQREGLVNRAHDGLYVPHNSLSLSSKVAADFGAGDNFQRGKRRLTGGHNGKVHHCHAPHSFGKDNTKECAAWLMHTNEKGRCVKCRV